MKKSKSEVILLSILIFIQIVIQIVVGLNKEYIHMDEAYSLGLASYDKTEIQNNEDFYNNWHVKEYYEDYLSIQADETGNYSQVYENQKNDVHPPLYYLILRIAMGFSIGHFSIWPGIIINIIIYIFITWIMYLILKSVIKSGDQSGMKAALIAFTSSLTLASLTNVIYIRMYTMLTLMILLTAFLHIKLLKNTKTDVKLFLCIGITALAGSLTHYYYLFYLVMLFFIVEIRYLKLKEYKSAVLYVLTMLTAGGASLLIFPYSVQHMFFGYRGQGVISNIKNPSVFLQNISSYILKLNLYGFNGLLFGTVAVLIIGKMIGKKRERENKRRDNKVILKSVYLPAAFYFIMAAIASPWVELRYIMPVSGIIFALFVCYTYEVLKSILNVRITNMLLAVFFIVLLLMPFVLKTEPEVLYSDKKQIALELEGEFNVPAVYFFNSNENRFLDDILLFTKLEESYIAKDILISEESIKAIFDEKDLSKGIVVFINEGQCDDEILENVMSFCHFKNVRYLKNLTRAEFIILIINTL